MAYKNNRTRKTIGIITGSGPEAGVDMWTKILAANKKRLGEDFHGDLDTPRVAIISEPKLGLSMELEQNRDAVWHYLKKTAAKLARLVDYYVIACNTLNYFQQKLEKLDLGARLVCFTDVVSDFVRRNHIRRLCLLGARPVIDLGNWSAYRRLPEIVDVEVPAARDQLHQLIYDIKTHGPQADTIALDFKNLLATIQSNTVLLACTELPLIRNVSTDKTLLDVTELVAAKLVEISFGNP
jgi:aspartate racemase